MSTIVGTLFFTVLMISGFSVMSLALDAQTDIVNTQRAVSDIEIKKQQERFGIAVSTGENDLLGISVSNLGQNPVEISSIWITNKTLSDQPATRYDVNYNDAFIPPGFTTNVLSTQSLEMIPDTYDIKVISAIGTIKTVEFASGSVNYSGLRAELITDPPDVIIGQNVTIAMMVTNTGSEIINNVQPDPLIFVSTGTGSVIASSSNTPTSVNLNSGASVMFSWDYQVTGGSGDQLTFSSIARGNGGAASGMVSDISILRLPTDGGSGGADPDIVNDDLFARPQLFFIIPSSQGEASTPDALWGMNVVNPVNAPMTVTKLIITAFAPGAQNNDKVFDRGGGACTFDTISPATGTWTCPSENSLMWKSSTGITIPANSTQSFLTQVEPGKPSGNTGLESIIVQGSVFTSLGSFGKAGYQSTMSSDLTSIVNVYLTSNIADPRNNAFFQTVVTGILPNELRTFNAVFADLDDQSTSIASPAKLIINVPKDWTDVDVTSWTGFPVEPSVTQFGDGSHQIVGTTNAIFGDTGANSARIITFEARAPNISDDQLYLMYILAQGDTQDPLGFTIGPTAEIVIQVDG